MSEEIIIYKIDHNDVITFIGNNWASFAKGNGWNNPVLPEDVAGHDLWEFITGFCGSNAANLFNCLNP
jgi:hypothetical protein